MPWNRRKRGTQKSKRVNNKSITHLVFKIAQSNHSALARVSSPLPTPLSLNTLGALLIKLSDKATPLFIAAFVSHHTCFCVYACGFSHAGYLVSVCWQWTCSMQPLCVSWRGGVCECARVCVATGRQVSCQISLTHTHADVFSMCQFFMS